MSTLKILKAQSYELSFFITNRMKKIAIQGIKGAFHEEAANLYFKKKLEIVPNLTFRKLVLSVENGSADMGIIAIENTISGTIHQNLKLVREHDVCISGEQKIRIIQNLGVYPGTKVEDLTEVRSHYMAINQCRNYFINHPHIQLIDEEDTALSAKNVMEQKLSSTGAIGSIAAMKHYGLDVLEKSIESNKLNYTRFLIIQKGKLALPEIGKKLTLQLILNHEVGALAKFLKAIQLVGASLTKIESLPIPGDPWNYEFYIDLEMTTDRSYSGIIHILHSHALHFEVLGRYTPSNLEL